MSARFRNWQNVIWREWRNSRDHDEYTDSLFEHVADKPVGWPIRAALFFSGLLFGIIGAVLVGFVVANWQSGDDAEKWGLSWESAHKVVWVSGLIAGALIPWLGRRLTWKSWFAMAEERGPVWKWLWVIVEAGGFRAILVWGIGVLIGLSVWLVGWQIGWLGGGLLLSLACIFIGWGIAHWAYHSIVEYEWLYVAQFGLPLGLIVGGLFVGLDAKLSGWLTVGLIGWWAISRRSIWQFLWLIKGQPWRHTACFAHQHRLRWLWWSGRPHPTEVEKALEQTGSNWWKDYLRRLEDGKTESRSADSLIAALQRQDAMDRFVARYMLVSLGGEAVPPLVSLVQSRKSDQGYIARWLIRCIAFDTTRRLASRTHRLLCPHHLLRFGTHKVRISWRKKYTYIGCRRCGQSREFLEGETVAVLDETMVHDRVEVDGVLRVNWLKRGMLFDFDSVEMIRATGEQVEHLAIQVGNDTDESRLPRYKKMRCVIAPDCHLSEHTMRILARTFGTVEHHI